MNSAPNMRMKHKESRLFRPSAIKTTPATNELFHSHLPFNRLINRQFDDQSLIDILSLMEYEEARLTLLELELGYGISSDAVVGLLFSYVLDALCWPQNNRDRDMAYEVFFTEPAIDRLPIEERLQQLKDLRLLC